ncbi:GspH/FimT family pseudopilin [Dyella sp. C11]|uniref:GspH/FimT family pseudopilin n=1 Tax=Dyella sp. C11 TaxID=2126991 RepID=UPI000D6560B5|nr:GspH/FimT family pseudopilin [Dyella sp. C11]
MTMQEAVKPFTQRGFSLIEQIAVLLVLAVLVSAAIPALGGLVARHRLLTAQYQLVASLQHARALAISSRRRVLLCPSPGGTQCVDDVHWEHGWATGFYQAGHADQLSGPSVLVHGAHARLTIVSSAGRKVVRFQPDGTAGGSTTTFTLCRRGIADGALAVTVSNVGRVAGAKPTEAYVAQCATEP